MDNKATTKRMIGAVVLVLVAALLLAWLLKGKNRDSQQQDLALGQPATGTPIIGFPGADDAMQKPVVADGANTANQQVGVLGIAPSTGQQQVGVGTLPGQEVKLPETASAASGLDVRPAGEKRDIVDIDGRVKDGTGSLGDGNAKPVDRSAPAAAPAPAPASAPIAQPAVREPAAADANASQRDKPATRDVAESKKPDAVSNKVVLVNERPVPRPEDTARAAAERASAARDAAAREMAAKMAAEEAKAKAAGSAGDAAKPAAADKKGNYVVQLIATSDRTKADALASPLKADGYKVAVTEANVGGKTVYRVGVSGFTSRAEAEAAQAKMKARYKQNPAIQGSAVVGG